MTASNGAAVVAKRTLTDIADAIREKNGETVKYKPSEMDDAIRGISGGGVPLLGGKVKIVNNGDQMPVANESYVYEGISPVGKFSIGDTVVADTHFGSGGDFSEVAAGVTIEIQDNILEDSVGFYIVSIDNEYLVTSVEDATVVYSVEDAHLSFTVPEVPVGKCLFVKYGLEG